MRAWPLLAALLLAGCASTPVDQTDTSSAPVAPTPDGGLPLPTWAVRDHWTYAIGDSKATYVVTADLGSDWMVDTDSQQRAFQNARDDVSRLGPQRKGDLAGSQGDDRVEFFKWPLADGKTWQTRWDHQPVTITAHVRGATATLEAVDAGGARVYNYTYDAAVGWFRSLKHYNPDGTLLIALELESSGHGWSGTAVRYTLKTLYNATGANGGADAKPLQPDAAATDLWLAYHLKCGSQGGGFSIALAPADPAAPNLVFDEYGSCVGAVDHEVAVTGPMGSPWTLAYSWGGSSPMTYTVEVVQRTREDVKVG
jgi:hypothetical protein